MKARLKQWAAAIGEWIQRHAFWIEVVGATLGAVLIAGIVADAALDRAAAQQRRAVELERTVREADAWIAEFEPPTPAESLAWRRSERDVLETAVAREATVGVAATIAQRAEELGLLDASVRFVDGDTIALPPARTADGRTFEPANRLLIVEIDGDFADLARLVGGLPPSVEVRRLDVSRTAVGVNARLDLVVYQRQDGDGAANAT